MSVAKFKRGDRVRVKNTHATKAGEVFTVTDTVEEPFSQQGPRYYRGDKNGGGVWEKYLDFAVSKTYKLTHKKNGSVLTITTDRPVAMNRGNFEGLIDGTTEPKITFVLSDWNVQEIKAPFVFPTGRSAVIEDENGVRYVRLRSAAWMHKAKYEDPEVITQSKFDKNKSFTVIFEGTD